MMKKIAFIALMVALPCVAFAAVAKKQSAIQNGTNVRARVAATGIYSAECYDAYYGCMDQFCISDNVNGGSCACSNDNAKYEDELKEINEMLAEAERVSTVEVEKIKLGSNVDIVFGGGRTYDDKGNVVYNTNSNATPKVSKNNRADLLKMFEVKFDDDDEEDIDEDNIMNKTGVALFNAADATCRVQVGQGCDKDMKFLRQTYQRQIESDCRGFANSIKQQRTAAQTAMNNAEKDVRTALKESFDAANKYNQGECIVQLKNCMMGDDACGGDWANCVSTVASENMQNNKVADDYTGMKINKTVRYNISPSVLERLEAKRPICERVLDQCMAVRNNVWDAFLREAAPTLKLAELNVESDMRQSCLTNITQCLHRACADDIAGKGKATMDACLSRPEMARDFCKNQLEPCERMAGKDAFWGYVKDKLLAMRVDSCTTEVKECFTDENRCGPDFMNCIGMDYVFIREMCPVDTLIACKGYDTNGDKKFTMDDVDSIIMGLYLNIDNKALENCQKLVEKKMTEICGSTTDCNKFASDDTIGTGSLRYQKDGAVHRLSGMISFGQIKVGSGTNKVGGSSQESDNDAGVIDISEYVEYLSDNELVTQKYETIADSVIYELKNIQGDINRVIDMIAKDPQIQYCVTGRDLTQIDRVHKRTMTTARFPHLLDQIKMQIAVAALRQAQNNYQAKYNEYLAKAMDGASTDIANLMCNKLPFADGSAQGISAADLNVTLLPPGAIVLEFAGISNSSLAAGGTHTTMKVGGTATVEHKSGNAAGGNDGGAVGTLAGTLAGIGGEFVKEGGKLAANLSFNPTVAIADMTVKTIGILESDHYKAEFDGGTREMWTTFNRDTRVCRLCSLTITKDCSTTYRHGVLGIGRRNTMDCTTSEPIEKCDEIPM